MSSITATVPGIDVSNYQPVIDWDAVVRSGMQYCFLKATEGGEMADRSFVRHWRGAAKAGMLRGAYHFFRPSVAPEAQAALFLRTVKELAPGDLPPVLDLEVPDAWTAIAPAERPARALTWIEIVEERLAVTPIVYLSPSFASGTLGNHAALARYPLWVAHYTAAENPKVPKPWSSWTFWQYGTARTPGIAVPVDVNRFNGSREQLKALAVQATTVQPVCS